MWYIYIYIYISKNTSIACINLNILKTRGDSKNPNPKIFIGKKNIHIPPIHLAILFVSAKHSGQKQQQQETRARTHTEPPRPHTRYSHLRGRGCSACEFLLSGVIDNTHVLQVLYSEQRLSGTRMTQLENATNMAWLSRSNSRPSTLRSSPCTLHLATDHHTHVTPSDPLHLATRFTQQQNTCYT